MKANLYIVPMAVMAALMAMPAQAKQGEFTKCMKDINKVCEKEKGDDFTDCLEKQYKEKQCESKLPKRDSHLLPLTKDRLVESEPYNPLDDLPKFPERLL